VDKLTGTYNAQLICYDCESWKGNELNLESEAQNWIWGSNGQHTNSDNEYMILQRHRYNGKPCPLNEGALLTFYPEVGWVQVDMRSSYFGRGVGIIPEVSASRVSTPEVLSTSSVSTPKDRVRGNWVAIHGLLLAGGFFILTPGYYAIRSGLAKSFTIHWLIQITASVAILAGCIIGIKISVAVSYQTLS